MVQTEATKRKHLIKLGLKEMKDVHFESLKTLLNDESLFKYIYDVRRNAILIDVELFDFIIYHLEYDKRYEENIDVTLIEADEDDINNFDIRSEERRVGKESGDERAARRGQEKGARRGGDEQ